MQSKTIYRLSTFTLFVPSLAGAQTLVTTESFFGDLFNGAVGLLITLAVVAFFWGLVRYLFTDGAQGKSNGLRIMFWGIITLFVMVSLWGIVRLLQNSFEVGGGSRPSTPTPPSGYIQSVQDGPTK